MNDFLDSSAFLFPHMLNLIKFPLYWHTFSTISIQSSAWKPVNPIYHQLVQSLEGNSCAYFYSLIPRESISTYYAIGGSRILVVGGDQGVTARKALPHGVAGGLQPLIFANICPKISNIRQIFYCFFIKNWFKISLKIY